MSNISVSKQELRILHILTQEHSRGSYGDEIQSLINEIPLDVLYSLRSTMGYSILHLACSSEELNYAIIII